LKRTANNSSLGLLTRAKASAAASASPIFARMLPLASMIKPTVTGVSSVLNSSIGTRRPLSNTTNCSRERSET
jgi:hypothetical protein